MLHPAQSINPYHKAPTLKMKCLDVPLIDSKERERERARGMVMLQRRGEDRHEATVCGGGKIRRHAERV